MKFSINKLILRGKNGTKRTIDFEKNKINIIVGDSSTGKTTIMHIIDYCLLGTKYNMPDIIVNENVGRYGINININNQVYTIAREAGENQIGSDNIYFSSVGEIPHSIPESKLSVEDMKKVLSNEFKIDESLTFSYGSNTIKMGTKISYRYFLLFNTQGENTIASTNNMFFDFNNDNVNRYKDALDRLFDIVIGADTIKNRLLKDRLEELEKEKIKFSLKKEALLNKDSILDIEKWFDEAKSYGLIDSKLKLNKESIDLLKQTINNMSELTKINIDSASVEILDSRRKALKLKSTIESLERLKREYKKSEELHRGLIDDGSIVNKFISKYGQHLKTEQSRKLLLNLEKQFSLIALKNVDRKPILISLTNKISQLRTDLSLLNYSLRHEVTEIKSFNNEQERILLIGQIKTIIDLYEKEISPETIDRNIEECDEQIQSIVKILGDRTTKKDEILSLFNAILNETFNGISKDIFTKKELNNKPYFKEKTKELLLENTETNKIENNPGSSSTSLFLHLTLILSLHKLFISQNTEYIPQYLILDQLSRPYYENENNNIISDDRNKLMEAFKMLDDFMNIMISNKEDFQIIVLEHAEKDIRGHLDNIHFVEHFTEGNALIPLDMIP